jgi:hypothetical protein
LKKIGIFIIPRPTLMKSKIQEKPSAFKKHYPALQNMKFLEFFLFLWVFFVITDPNTESGFGSTHLIESGSETLPKVLKK